MTTLGLTFTVPEATAAAAVIAVVFTVNLVDGGVEALVLVGFKLMRGRWVHFGTSLEEGLIFMRGSCGVGDDSRWFSFVSWGVVM